MPSVELPNTREGDGAALSSTIRSQIRTDIRALRKSFQKGQRDVLRQGLISNRKKLEAALAEELDVLTARPPSHIPVTAVSLGPVGEVNRKREGPTDVVATVLEAAPQIPAYKSWSRMARNEKAVLTGLKQFYLDDTGETVEASDSEADSDCSDTIVEAVLDGPKRGWSEYVLRHIFVNHGSSLPVKRYVAKVFHASLHTLEERLVKLGVTPIGQATLRKDASSSASGCVGGPPAAALYCCRCHLFNCMLHPGVQIPDPQPQPPSATGSDAARIPCGTACYRIMYASLPQPGTPRALTAAAADRGGDRCSRGRMKRRRTEAGSDNNASSSSNVSGASSEAEAPSDADSEITAHQSGRQDAMSPLQLPLHHSTGAATAGMAVTQAAAASVEERLWTGWTGFQKRALKNGVLIFGRDVCAIARLALRPCDQVYAQLARTGSLPDCNAHGATGGASRPGRRKTKNNPRVVRMRNQHDPDQPWPAYSPCNCSGVCDNDCSCAKAGNFCERYCACSQSCGVRFLGCSCKSKRNRCGTKSCPCYAADRECDPELCELCTATCIKAASPAGAAAAASAAAAATAARASHTVGHPGVLGGDPTLGDADCAGPPIDEGACCNMKIRLKQSARIVMGLSKVAGWGAYIAAPAVKHDLLGEYTGEIISHAEADRRGKSYDRDNNSYLFSLNSDCVLDARRRGNKLRFANHSQRPNCYTRVVTVDGEHRVGVFAKRDLPAGTELMYDYRYDRATAPSWRTDFEDFGSS